MTINRIPISASPAAIFAVLNDPHAYAEWVVGTGEVTGADPSWPSVGAVFTYRIGDGPATWEGSTEVVARDANRCLTLRTALPFGLVDIDIEVEENESGCYVTMTEAPAQRLLQHVLAPPFHFRNAQTLANLKAIVEGRAVRLLDPVLALGPVPHWLSLPGFREVLNDADRCHIAIQTKRGPHVTPAAYVVSSGRMWMLVERSSLKARLLAKRPAVGVLVRSRNRSIVITGTASVLDPLRALIPEHLVTRLHAAPALLRYLAGNRARLTGYLAASLATLASLNPAKRVLISIAPRSAALVEDDRVVEQRGERSQGSALRHLRSASGRGPRLDLDEAPESIAEMAEEGRAPAVVAWESASGPLALPAHWHAKRRLASVPTVLLQGTTEAATALCLDSDEDSDLDDLEGMLVRGRGRVKGVRGGYAAIAIEPDKTTTWSGADTQTIQR